MTNDTTNGKLRTLREIVADLSLPIPAQYLGTKKKGGASITIFSWVVCQRFLDMLAPGWHGTARPVLSSERVACAYEICIPTADYGMVCRGATGDDDEDEDEGWGSPMTRAEAQAFKRAAARFGFGLYLRDKGMGGSPTIPVPAKPPHAVTGKEPLPEPDEVIPTPIRRPSAGPPVKGKTVGGERAELYKKLGDHASRLKLGREEVRSVVEYVTGESLPADKVSIPDLRTVETVLSKLKDRAAVVEWIRNEVAMASTSEEPDAIPHPADGQ